MIISHSFERAVARMICENYTPKGVVAEHVVTINTAFNFLKEDVE